MTDKQYINCGDGKEIRAQYVTAGEFQASIECARRELGLEPHFPELDYINLSGGADKPVVGVHLSDAEMFCKWLDSEDPRFSHKIPSFEQVSKYSISTDPNLPVGCWCYLDKKPIIYFQSVDSEEALKRNINSYIHKEASTKNLFVFVKLAHVVWRAIHSFFSVLPILTIFLLGLKPILSEEFRKRVTKEMAEMSLYLDSSFVDISLFLLSVVVITFLVDKLFFSGNLFIRDDCEKTWKELAGNYIMVTTLAYFVVCIIGFILYVASFSLYFLLYIVTFALLSLLYLVVIYLVVIPRLRDMYVSFFAAFFDGIYENNFDIRLTHLIAGMSISYEFMIFLLSPNLKNHEFDLSNILLDDQDQDIVNSRGSLKNDDFTLGALWGAALNVLLCEKYLHTKSIDIRLSLAKDTRPSLAYLENYEDRGMILTLWLWCLRVINYFSSKIYSTLSQLDNYICNREAILGCSVNLISSQEAQQSDNHSLRFLEKMAIRQYCMAKYEVIKKVDFWNNCNNLLGHHTGYVEKRSSPPIFSRLTSYSRNQNSFAKKLLLMIFDSDTFGSSIALISVVSDKSPNKSLVDNRDMAECIQKSYFYFKKFLLSSLLEGRAIGSFPAWESVKVVREKIDVFS